MLIDLQGKSYKQLTLEVVLLRRKVTHISEINMSIYQCLYIDSYFTLFITFHCKKIIIKDKEALINIAYFKQTTLSL